MVANQIKRNIAIKLDGDIGIVIKFEHHKPGKGAAIVRAHIKSISKQTTIEHTFRSGDAIEEVELEKSNATYSYEDGNYLIFMDTNTYDQINILKKDIEQYLLFFKEDTEVQILLHEEKPIFVIPPNFVELRVHYAENAVRGDTATNATKEVELETGGKVYVPLFIKQNDVIKIDLRDMKYVERVN